jgi:peptidoglycan hydrolase-like protein with peptidoglycan-binding domain
MFGGPAPDTGAPLPPIAATGPGSEEQIRWIQSVLNTVQGANLPTDGIPSPDLRAALQTFQSQHGLPVSGFAGPDTIAALQAAAAGGAAGGSGAAPPAAQPDAAGGAAPSSEFEILPFRTSP